MANEDKLNQPRFIWIQMFKARKFKHHKGQTMRWQSSNGNSWEESSNFEWVKSEDFDTLYEYARKLEDHIYGDKGKVT